MVSGSGEDDAAVRRVRVLPADITFTVRDGETIFRAAVRHGLRWPSLCGGDCECGICYLVVEQGEHNLAPLGADEATRLATGMKAAEPRARLACRARPTGDVTVRRSGVRPADPT